MSKITQVQFQPRSHRSYLYVDGVFFASLNTEAVLKRNIKVSEPITETDLKNLLEESILIDLRQGSLSQIGLRPHSTKEITNYCQQRINKLINKLNCSNQAKRINITTDNTSNLIKQTIEYLVKNNYLNDEKFARWWVQSRISSKPKGKNALYAELQSKGIEKQIIDKILSDETLISQETTQNMLDKLIEKIWKAIQNRKYSKLKAKQIMIQRLYSKGFDYTQTKDKIDEFLSSKYNN
jgi:regulatory protein